MAGLKEYRNKIVEQREGTMSCFCTGCLFCFSFNVA